MLSTLLRIKIVIFLFTYQLFSSLLGLGCPTWSLRVIIGPTVSAGETPWSIVDKMVMISVLFNSSAVLGIKIVIFLFITIRLVVFFSSGSGVIHRVAEG